MHINQLDLKSLESCTADTRWGAGTDSDRFLYRDERYWYKIWGARYFENIPYSSDGKFLHHLLPLDRPHGFVVGLFVPEISCAFVEFIYDENDKIVGYVTRSGIRPSSVSIEFIDAVYKACLDCGWVYADFCFNNVISVDGVLSLIDFDTHLTDIKKLNRDFEMKHGALREHVFLRFREKLNALIDV